MMQMMFWGFHRRAVLDRRALIAVGEKLVREVAQLREEVKQVKESVADRNIDPLSGDIDVSIGD